MGQIIIAIIIAAIFTGAYLIRVTLVNQFVVPTVKETLEKEKFLREQIQLGKFIVVNEDEFAKNHPIDPKYVNELEQGKYSKLVENIESIVEEKIQPIEDRAKKLESRIDDVEAIHKAESEDSIKVKLYISTNDVDKDFLVLNGKNPAIAHWLKNGSYYQLKALSVDSTQCVKLRLDTGMPDEAGDKNTTKAIGRLSREQFDGLFEGSNSRGMGAASVQLEKLESCNK